MFFSPLFFINPWFFEQKNPRPQQRDEVNRGTTLIPVSIIQALGLRNVQHTLSPTYLYVSFKIHFQRYSSRAKFDSCLNQRKLTADDFLSLLENSSLLITFIAFDIQIPLYFSILIVIVKPFLELLNLFKFSSKEQSVTYNQVASEFSINYRVVENVQIFPV